MRILVFIALSLSPTHAFAAAQTGGNYVPPSGTDLTEWKVQLNVDCSTGKITPFGGLGNTFRIVSPIFSAGQLDILAQNHDADRTPLLTLLDSQQVGIRANPNQPFVSVGTYSQVDITRYCQSEAAYTGAPGQQIPDSEFPITLNPGVEFQLSRHAETTFEALPHGLACVPNSEIGTSSRWIRYQVTLTAPGNSQTFSFENEFITDRASCQNWQEIPWVSSGE